MSHGVLDGASEGPASGAWRWAALAGLFVALAALALLLPPNHDVGWFLYLGGRVLDGARPYVDFVEINPPPVLGAETVVAALARGLGVDALRLHAVLTLLLCGGSAALVLRALRGRLRDGRRRALFGAALLAVLVAYAGYNLGQREHLGVVLLLPYLAALGAGIPVGAGLSVLAAAGIALKPHLVLVLAGAELAAWRRPGRRLLVVGGVLAVLAAASVLAAPGYLPLALHLAPAYVGFGDVSRLSLLRVPPTGLSLAAAGMALVVGARGTERRLVRTLVGAAFGALASLLVQGKYFAYHFYPLEALAILALAAALLSRLGRPGRWALPLAAAGAVALGMLKVRQSEEVIRLPMHERPALEAAVRRVSSPGETLLGLTWTPQSTFPLVNRLGLRWTSPYNSLWVISGAAGKGRRGLLREAVRRIADAAATPPDVVVLDTAPAVQPPYLRAADYLRASPRLAGILSSYRVVGAAGRFVVLRPPPTDSAHQLELGRLQARARVQEDGPQGPGARLLERLGRPLQERALVRGVALEERDAGPQVRGGTGG